MNQIKMKSLIREEKKYSKDDILKLKKSIEETIKLFHPAIWALEDGSKEQEQFIKMNNILNTWYHKILKKHI